MTGVEMETDGGRTVLLGSSSSGIRPGLHGLVMMNVSEHIVRNKMNNPQIPVVGAILGTLNGRDVEIFTSFELLVRDDMIDEQYLQTKGEQYKEVMPTCDVLGWYTTSKGSQVDEWHVRIQTQFMKWNDNSLLLLADPSPPAIGEAIPLAIYESIVDTRNVSEDGEPRLVFCPVEYDVETVEAERVAIDHVATKIDHIGNDGSKTAVHLMSQHAAVKMLMNRVTRILEYLQRVERGNLKGDPSTLRRINALVGALSLSRSAELEALEMTQKNEVLLSTLIGLMARCCESVDEVTQHAIVMKSFKGNNGPML